MKSVEFEAKTKEEAIDKAIQELGIEKTKMIYSSKEQKGKLFKSASCKLTVYVMDDIIEFIKSYLSELLNNMEIDATFESMVRDNQITIKMYSDKNAILIGKNGQTLSGIQNIIRQVLHKETNNFINVILDVENYKEKQVSRIERLAKQIAKEVRETKTEVHMENMNSYERRIVHNILSDYKDISTNSEGEEPNRHIVVKIK